MSIQPMNSGMEEFVVEKETRIVPQGDMFGPLLELALSKENAIDVIERLLAARKDELKRVAEIDFNDALNRVQQQIKRIAPDLTNSDKGNKYASYAAIDRILRPLYTAEGFSLSFTHADSPLTEHIRVICWLRRKGHKEPYQVDWPVTTTGPKGGAVMTPTQAVGSSDSYAKRYLVKDIWNIAIGEDDTDGNAPEMPKDEMEKAKAAINKANTPDDLRLAFGVAYKAAARVNDRQAMSDLILEKDRRKMELEAS